MKTIFQVCSIIALISCKAEVTPLAEPRQVKSSLIAQYYDSMPLMRDACYPELKKNIYVRSNREDLINSILPSDNDSTLLTTLYGSCYLRGKTLVFNFGPQEFYKEDSTYMKIEERLDDSLMQVVYVRGEIAITTVNHNHFNETILLLNKVDNGWKIRDAVLDERVIDYSHVEMSDTAYKNYKIIKYTRYASYASGCDYGDISYSLVSKNSLSVNEISFMFQSSNGATMQCYTEEGDTNAVCDCYDHNGSVKFRVDKNLDCLVFEYKANLGSVDCNGKRRVITPLKQTWYMNADTVFQSKGPIVENVEYFTGKKVNLSYGRIKNALKKKK
jgi:hypothetical protein